MSRMKTDLKGRFFVYILKCGDTTYYTGWTPDPEKRLRTHNQARGAKYTRGRLPVELVWQKKCRSKSEALSVETAVKKLSRTRKQELINGRSLHDLLKETKPGKQKA